MNTSFVYFLLLLKRSLKLLYKSVFSMFIMSILLISLAFGIREAVKDMKMLKQIIIGISIPANEKETIVITNVIATMESMKALCRFEKVKEDEVSRMIADGEIDAAIVIPQGTYDSIYNGSEATVSIWLPSSSKDTIKSFQEIVNTGAMLVHVTEAAAFTAIDAAYEYKLEAPSWEIADYVSKEFIKKALLRGTVYKSILNPLTERINLATLLLLCGIGVIMQTYGPAFSVLYEKEAKAIEEKLKMYGVSTLQTSVFRICAMVMVLMIVFVFLYTLSGITIQGITLKSLIYLIGFLMSFTMAIFYDLLYRFTKSARETASIVFAADMIAVLLAGFAITGGVL